MLLIVFFVLVFVISFNFLSHRFVTRRDTTITFVAGQIGAGKSAYSVKCARAALKRGRPVYSTDYIQGCNRFNIEWLHHMKCPVNSLLIIDEAALKFNSRDYGKIGKDILAFFKKARHFGNDVILISQTFGDSDKQIREVANRVLFIRKLGWLAMPVRVKGDISIGDDGQPSMKYKIGKFGLPYIPALQGKYYDSFNDDENRAFCPDIPWDIVPSTDDEPDLTVSEVDSVVSDQSEPDRSDTSFSVSDAKKLISDFKSGKGIDLSQFLPFGGDRS